jgi:flagellar biogenesis protein FliO
MKGWEIMRRVGSVALLLLILLFVAPASQSRFVKQFATSPSPVAVLASRLQRSVGARRKLHYLLFRHRVASAIDSASGNGEE